MSCTLYPGEKLEITEYAHFNFKDNPEMAELILLTPEELKEKEKDSVQQEEAIGSELNNTIAKWISQAQHTVNLRRAQEYLNLFTVQHTKNCWTEDGYGLHEISNMVYRMTWRVNEQTRWNAKLKKNVLFAWDLSWYIWYNTSPRADYSGPGRQIAGQDKKRFTDIAQMERYLQGRIKAYSHLFVEISPPIPKEDKKRFCFNGILLPGYTVESPELLEPDKAEVDDLLSFLEDEDIGGEAPQKEVSAPQLEEQSPEAIWSRNRRQRQRTSKPPQAPAR